MHTFYAPGLSGDSYLLDPQESKHCTRVLRLREGARVCLLDGLGGVYEAEIAEASDKKTLLKVLACERPERPSGRLHLAVAPPKNPNRFDWFLEKATELGIDRITPLVCDHSERRVLNVERARNLLVSALKQSKGAWLPQLDEPMTLDDLLAGGCAASLRWMPHCQFALPRQPLRDLLPLAGRETSVCVLIGPEGDFSPREVDLATAAGFTPLDLGHTVLRVETAALLLVAALHTQQGR